MERKVLYFRAKDIQNDPVLGCETQGADVLELRLPGENGRNIIDLTKRDRQKSRDPIYQEKFKNGCFEEWKKGQKPDPDRGGPPSAA